MRERRDFARRHPAVRHHCPRRVGKVIDDMDNPDGRYIMGEDAFFFHAPDKCLHIFELPAISFLDLGIAAGWRHF